jgi:hypothetical protein
MSFSCCRFAHDARQRFELGRRQRALIHYVDQRVEMLVAGHRHVPPVPIVDTAERHLIEAVDVDHCIEQLSDGQKITEHQQLLRLFVALVTEAQGHRLTGVERSAATEIFLESRGAQSAEVRADRSSEDPDDKLPIAGLRKRIVDA